MLGCITFVKNTSCSKSHSRFSLAKQWGGGVDIVLLLYGNWKKSLHENFALFNELKLRTFATQSSALW